MKLYYDKKSKNPTYFIQMGFRKGRKASTKNIKRIGKHDDLLKITNDPLAYSKQQVKLFNQEYENGKVTLTQEADLNQRLIAGNHELSIENIRNVGYLYLHNIYRQLNLKSFFDNITKGRKITFSCYDINRFLVYSQILNPQSKLATLSNLYTFFEEPDFDHQHILRFMDVLEEHMEQYIAHLYKHSLTITKRDTTVCFYDCTNYYFECNGEDAVIDDATGEVFSGLRKFGHSKESRPNPIVQMGLFIDGDGIPISMNITPGNTNEQTTAIPLEKEIIKMFENKRFIYCADAGLGSLNIRKFNSMGGRAFVVTQSIKKLSNKLQNAVFNDFDYRKLSDNSPITLKEMKDFNRTDSNNSKLCDEIIYKVINADALVDVGLEELKELQDGSCKTVKSKATLHQRVIITFSRKTMEYQRSIRNVQIERAKKILEKGNVVDIKKGPNDVTRFIKRISKSKSNESVIDNYMLNKDVIENEEKYDGFYAIATNLEDEAKDIIEINSGRYKVEECFRMLKTNFGGRPTYHRSPERIISHFLICFTALFLYRLLEKKLKDNGKHYSINKIVKELNTLNVNNVNDCFYESTYTPGTLASDLDETFNLGLNKKYYTHSSLNKKIKKN